MVHKTLFIMTLSLLFTTLGQFAYAADPDLLSLTRDADFQLFAPSLRGMDWKLDIPQPSPYTPGEQKIAFTRFSYFDKSGNDYLLGIEQRTAEEYYTTSSANNASNNNGEPVRWNSTEAQFRAWADREDNGGFLRWIQNQTYNELSSVVLSKKQMIDIAKSIKSIR
ncbi:hypothetical protein JCM10914A_31030 [Paenibacillus sp. JCM 10914]|uniref:DUF4367 domain-containing protein n=1 Tax=Paenibacillus sp. JCM 10914 TaxID=1236974 RepID=UPI0003CC35BE|nr:DUF4367 domain-containing protein [Paenibacillus sp. JCM 10914]GAE07245.1 hypothetical protein JCM10914_3461 [Paenibacillus sp. JCM 10914]